MPLLSYSNKLSQMLQKSDGPNLHNFQTMHYIGEAMQVTTDGDDLALHTTEVLKHSY
jgi:hypothetical protein